MRISGALRERIAAPEASRAPGPSAYRARAAAAPAVPRAGRARGLTAGRGLRPSRVPARSRPAGPAGVQGGAPRPADDRYEREADTVARRLVGRGGIQGTRLAAAPVAAADGAPLPDELRTVLEPRFGADFGGVRLHTGAHADRLSTALHARAVTTGRDVFFRHGTYAPGSQAGQWLLAHELAHVVQLVNVGDLIMDLGPWSSSGIRRSHEGVDFGSQGTLQEPRVHFIINGLTGVFLPRYTNTETEVREVLFQARTIFRVTKITNYFDLTFFVWVDEVDPSTLGTHPRTKNPYSGAVNR